jgi:hypothetical protein
LTLGEGKEKKKKKHKNQTQPFVRLSITPVRSKYRLYSSFFESFGLCMWWGCFLNAIERSDNSLDHNLPLIMKLNVSAIGAALFAFVVIWNVSMLNMSTSTVSIPDQAKEEAELISEVRKLRAKFDVTRTTLTALSQKMEPYLLKATEEQTAKFELDDFIQSFADDTEEDMDSTLREQSKQTLVLPIAQNDLDRFQNLYTSLLRFFDFSSVREWIIIVPVKALPWVDELKSITLKHKNLIRIVEDSEVIGTSHAARNGWFTQQIIKLGIAKHVSTRFYLVLDAGWPMS